ncbi:MAG: hypothetical protein V7637_4983 [Mycobacteriales bacterium]
MILGLVTNAVTEIIDDLLDTADREARGAGVTEPAVRFDSRRPGARTRRQLGPADVDRLVRELAARLERLRQVELRGVPEHEWLAAVDAVRESLAAVTPVTPDLLFGLDLRADRLDALVRARSAAVLRQAGLSAPARAVYDRVLAESCRQVLEFVTSRPGFAARAHLATVHAAVDLRGAVDTLADRPAVDRAAAERGFEQRYRALVARALDTLELFGVTLGRTPTRYPMHTAYVDLSAARLRGGALPATTDPGLTGAGIGVGELLADTPRVLLRGGAGAGKTTALQWLAVRAAADPSGPVPFFVPLRQYATRELPAPEDFLGSVGREIAGMMPDGWVHDRLAEGRALVLLDGVDELPEQRRRTVQRWLEGLVTAFGGARWVITARPSAVEDGWLAGSGFVTYDLLPMSGKAVRDFLRQWHDAAREECGDDAEERARLDALEEALARTLPTHRELLRLSSSPLLCALICALHRDRNMQLPRDRKGIYDAALEMLLVRWDSERGVTPPEGISLGLEEQTVLLQRFAYWLIRNGLMFTDHDTAVDQVGRALRGVQHSDAEPAAVFRHLLLRTGLLREPTPDHVQFTHRTFQDFLGAKEAVEAGDLPMLVNHAHEDQWHDVVVAAVAHARPRERATLLRGLLQRGDKQADQHHRLHLVAAACLEQATVVEPPQVRRQVEAAAARLIPPANLDDAETLAKAGSFVLGLLPPPDGLTEAQSAAVIRTAAMIGGEAARLVISRFARDGDTGVLDEMLRAWRLSPDPAEYARVVLADVQFGDRCLDVRGNYRVRQLRYLLHLRAVRCRGDVVDIAPLAAVPKLERLELIQNDVLRDVTPLATCGTLRDLSLTFCGLVKDLSPLGPVPLDRLALHFMAGLDPRTLGALRSLTTLRIRDRAVAADLQALPGELPLRTLAVGNRLPEASLRGVERWAALERVELVGVPGRADIRLLAELPALTDLVLRDTAAADSLTDLRDLPALRSLLLEGRFDDPAAVSRHLARPGLDVTVRSTVSSAGAA